MNLVPTGHIAPPGPVAGGFMLSPTLPPSAWTTNHSRTLAVSGWGCARSPSTMAGHALAVTLLKTRTLRTPLAANGSAVSCKASMTTLRRSCENSLLLGFSSSHEGRYSRLAPCSPKRPEACRGVHCNLRLGSRHVLADVSFIRPFLRSMCRPLPCPCQSSVGHDKHRGLLCRPQL
jgi:hypothetical protein